MANGGEISDGKISNERVEAIDALVRQAMGLTEDAQRLLFRTASTSLNLTPQQAEAIYIILNARHQKQIQESQMATEHSMAIMSDGDGDGDDEDGDHDRENQ